MHDVVTDKSCSVFVSNHFVSAALVQSAFRGHLHRRDVNGEFTVTVLSASGLRSTLLRKPSPFITAELCDDTGHVGNSGDFMSSCVFMF